MWKALVVGSRARANEPGGGYVVAKILITPYYQTTELVQDIWSRYGFKGNPFDTEAPLSSTGALLPVSKAYVYSAHCIDGVARFLAR